MFGTKRTTADVLKDVAKMLYELDAVYKEQLSEANLQQNKMDAAQVAREEATIEARYARALAIKLEKLLS
jgi:hypothetical protein